MHLVIDDAAGATFCDWIGDKADGATNTVIESRTGLVAETGLLGSPQRPRVVSSAGPAATSSLGL
jgi:hypothetical protein